MNKKTQGELTRAILESLSVADIEAILREKKNAQIATKTKPKPLTKWKRWELYCETELKKILRPPNNCLPGKQSKQILLSKQSKQ